GVHRSRNRWELLRRTGCSQQPPGSDEPDPVKSRRSGRGIIGATMQHSNGDYRGGTMAPRATGVSRKVDDLGRIVLPAELRRSFDIREGDHVEISVEDDYIVLSKRRSLCTFCGGADGLR